MLLLNRGFLTEHFPIIAGKDQGAINAFTQEEAKTAAEEMYRGFLEIEEVGRQRATLESLSNNDKFDEKEQKALICMLDTFLDLVVKAGGYAAVFEKSDKEVIKEMQRIALTFFGELV